MQGATRADVGVRVRGATLAFEQQLLFQDLEVDLSAGRTTCLLGPSGVGKSSLIRLVAGLARLESGHVAASDGRSLDGRIAWMSQRDSLLPWLSAEGNVVLGARLRGAEPDHDRARRLLLEVGLSGLEARRPAMLSGGQRQRVALARTLMEDRPVVLMDEPFSALDAITRTRLQALAARLLAARTVLLVTHDPLEALRLGHRVMVMAGRPATVEEVAPPPGDPPRDLGDPRLLALQADLLARLAAADELAA